MPHLKKDKATEATVNSKRKKEWLDENTVEAQLVTLTSSH
jgi:hypothetical protein